MIFSYWLKKVYVDTTQSAINFEHVNAGWESIENIFLIHQLNTNNAIYRDSINKQYTKSIIYNWKVIQSHINLELLLKDLLFRVFWLKRRVFRQTVCNILDKFSFTISKAAVEI